MQKYIVRRLAIILPTILFVSFLVFLIINMTPGSPGQLILGENASKTQIQALNEKLGYNRPYLIRYGDYLVHLVQGDFGVSYRTGRPVITEIMEKFPVSAKLAVFSIFVGAALGILFGIIAAVKQYSIMDGASTVVSIFLSSVPQFWLALLAILLFSLRLKLLPSFGMTSPINYVLPVATIASFTLARTLRMTRTTMLEAIRQDFVRTAKAKGATKRQVILKHVLKNALLPVITQVGVDFGYLLGGTVVIEQVFTINGIGSLILSAISNKDAPLLMGAVIFLSMLFMLVMLLIDILSAYIDPRIKGRYLSGRKC